MDNWVCEQVGTRYLWKTKNQEAKYLLHSRLNLVGARITVVMDDVQSFLLTLNHWLKECPNDTLCLGMRRKKI